MKNGLCSAERFDRRQQETGCIRLEQKAAGARSQQVADERLVVVHRKYQHFRTRQPRTDLPRRLDAVDQRQGVIENGNIGLELKGLCHGLLAVRGLTDHFPLRLGFQDSAEAGPHYLMVVGDQDTGHGGGIPFRFGSLRAVRL